MHYTTSHKSALISASQSLQPGTSTTLLDCWYGLVYHAMCLFTSPAFTVRRACGGPWGRQGRCALALVARILHQCWSVLVKRWSCLCHRRLVSKKTLTIWSKLISATDTGWSWVCHWVILLFGLVFCWDLRWCLNSDWDQRSAKNVKSFFRLVWVILWAFSWDQTSDWAIVKSKAN